MKNEKWLITIDLDGTFLNTGKPGKANYSFSDYNAKIIKKVISKGHEVSIITGRPWRDAKVIYEKLGLKSIIGNYNGAHIHNPNNEEFVDLTFSINQNILNDVLKEKELSKMTNSIVVETLEKIYVSKSGSEMFLERISASQVNNCEWKVGERLPMNPQAVYISLDYKKHDPFIALQILKRKYGDSLFFRLWDERDNGWMLMEINQKGSNKGTALKYIASYYNIPLSNTIAFGDGLNDKEMLTQSSIGVAMKNAKGTVKTYASDTTDFTNDDSGVGKYLKDFFDLK